MISIRESLVSAPFNDDEIKSFNRYQADGRTNSMSCRCGGKYYAREDGIRCGKCHDFSEIIPKFTSNWSWNKFKYTKKEEENGVS